MFVNGLAFFVVVLHLTYENEAAQPCQTPNDQYGECIPIKKCPSLHSLLIRGSSISSSQSTFLRRSQCGFTGAFPKVCCPLGLSSHPSHPKKNKNEDSSNFVTSYLLPDLDTCGLGTQGKIVGGNKTDLDEFPWMALLAYKQDNGELSLECGGFLISKRYVVTAAHCLIDGLVSVRLGEWNLDTDPDCVVISGVKDCAPPAIDVPIEEKIKYEAYDSDDDNHYHDIALLRLKRDVHFNDFIKPICLPTTTDEIYKSYIGKRLVVAGWGRTEKSFQSSVKLKVQVPVRDLEDCHIAYRKLYGVNISLDVGQLCAGGEKGKDSCGGDSGGPLMAIKLGKDHDPRFYAIGAVSYGPSNCGSENQPSVYTKVSKYVGWIVENLRP